MRLTRPFGARFGGAVTVALVILSLVTAPSASADDVPATGAVSSATVTTSAPIVYPAEDGYIDGVHLVVTPVTSDGAESPATGRLTITHSGKTVTSWAVGTAAPTSVVWHGRVHGKLVTGTFVATAAFTNPDATVAEAHVTLKVSAKKLVAKRWTKELGGSGGSNTCYPPSPEPIKCQLVSKAKRTNGVTKFSLGLRYVAIKSDFDPQENAIEHTVALPTALRKSVKSSAFSVSAHYTVSGAKKRTVYLTSCQATRSDAFGGGCSSAKTFSKTSTVTSHTAKLAPGAKKVGWTFSETHGVSTSVMLYTLHVKYYVLK